MTLHHENEFDFVVPEFIDIHCHGGNNAYFWNDFGRARNFHREKGTGIQFASLVTLSKDETKRAISYLAKQNDLAGIHLEGPFISQDYCGAHQPDLIRDPDLQELRELLNIGEGKIRMVTIAPERPGAIPAIEYLVANGVIVALGHSAADAETTNKAMHAGATVVTHFNNGMAKMGAQDSLSQAALSSQLFLEVIPDLLHLSREELTAVISTSSERTIAITDAMSAAGSADGRYTIGGLEVNVKNGEARLATTGKLAGSTLTMLDAFLNIEKFFGLDLAIAMTSTNARKILGLTEKPRLIGIKGRTVAYLD